MASAIPSSAYAPVKVDEARGGAEKGIRVTTEVRNTGNRPGDEVAQLYPNFPNEPGTPRAALRGFQRVSSSRARPARSAST